MKNVEDIYPVSPMQEFMLLHSLSAPSSDTLFNQFVFRVNEPLNPDAFENAWNHVAASHASLRTAFIWKGVDMPQQVVRQTVNVACTQLDVSDADDGRRDAEVARLLDEDRRRGFDFRKAPLMRFMLIRTGPEEWLMVWSSHHLVLDRWCIDGLFESFQRAYSALGRGETLRPEKAPSYRNYIRWIKEQDRAAAHRYWAGYLRGFHAPTTARRLFGADAFRGASEESHSIFPVSDDLTQRAREYAARERVTLSCIVQSALALAIDRLTGVPDVVFGLTVSGRPAGLVNVEDIVGSFISTVPFRVRPGANVQVGDWLRQLNAAQFASGGFDYLSPAQLRRCASLASGQPLFELLMVWLAQTRVEHSSPHDEALTMTPVSEQYASAYPVTLSVIEQPDRLVLRADAAHGQRYPLSPLLEAFAQSLEDLVLLSSSVLLAQVEGLSLAADPEDDVATDLSVSDVVVEQSVELSAGREGLRLEQMEELLRTEWQGVLDTDADIDRDDDFFELGGDSLRAAALHSRIEAATRKATPLLSMFERSTLGGMAQTLVDEKWPLRAGISFPMNTGGTGPVLFCVASPEVNTLGYAMLSRHLGNQLNTVLLQAPPDTNALRQMHPDELPEFAARYVRALRAVQPRGPYHLLSMCSGAHIALNMIRQLESEGDQVRFAGVINTWSLYSISWKFYVNRLLNVAGYYKSRINQLVRTKMPFAAQQELSMASGSQVQNTKRQPAVQVQPTEEEVGLDNPWIRQVGFAHRLPDTPAVAATFTVFRLQRQPYWRIRNHALGWSRLAQSTETVDVDGDDHDSILREPDVRHFAERLQVALGKLADVDPSRSPAGQEPAV